MTENRIRELRKSHNMSQEALGAVINTTQQAVIIPELSEPPVRTLGATIPENESHIFR